MIPTDGVAEPQDTFAADSLVQLFNTNQDLQIFNRAVAASSFNERVSDSGSYFTYVLSGSAVRALDNISY